jgi:hypothetical protein
MPTISFAAVVSGTQKMQFSQQQQPQTKQSSSGRPEERESEEGGTLTTGMSVRASGNNGTSLGTMFRVATVVQQIMRELNDAASEEEKSGRKNCY